jgi:hypothetical protein
MGRCAPLPCFAHSSFAGPSGNINDYVEKNPHKIPVWEKINESVTASFLVQW